MTSGKTSSLSQFTVIVIYLTFLPSVRYNIFVTNNSKIFNMKFEKVNNLTLVTFLLLGW
jgi:hypothetical protein